MKNVKSPDPSANLSTVLITLMKGVTYRDADERRWQSLLSLSARVQEHVAVLGLELVLDESEGYAYLKQRALGEDEAEVPRLVARRQFGYHVSLLLALLRKKLAEQDATSSETRLVLGREDITEMMRLFLADSSNEARAVDRVDSHINKIVELGFLRALHGEDGKYEVHRILKAFVDAQWLNELEERLARYRAHHASSRDPQGGEA